MRVGLVAAIIACLPFGLALAQTAARQAPRLAQGTPIPPAELEALVDGVVRDDMARDHIAGVAVAVVQDGRVVLKKGYGFAGPGRLVDPDRTLFRIGSISKTFTWIAAMKEVEAGRMRLDGAINDYLPADLAIPAARGWRPVELRDLMSHTPGFEDRPLYHMFAGTPAQVLPLASELALMRPERVFPPGTTLAYSNYGVALTGEAVAHLEGAGFQDVVEREIIWPLDLAHTTFREPYPPRADLPQPMPRALAAEVATGYRWAGGELKAEPFEWLSQLAPAAAGSTTAGDMARYMLMMLGDGKLDGVRIYSPATALAFRTPIPLPAPGVGQMDHGFVETQLPGGFVGHGHDGDTLWTHSNLVTIPALKLGVFVATNTDTGGKLAEDLPGRVVGRFYAPPPALPPAGSPAVARQRAVYAGTYLTNRRPFTGLEKFLFLVIGQGSVGVTGDGYLVTSRNGEDLTWTPSGRPGHLQQVDGPLTTDFAVRGGRAVRWYPPGGTESFDRIGPLYQRNVLLAVLLLACAAAVATLIGAAIRFRRAAPTTNVQRALNAAQLAAAGAWLAAVGAGAVLASGADDISQLIYNWPGAPLVVASSAALAASLLSAAILIALPLAWRGDAGWGAWRKLRFTATSLIFCALGLQLAVWGFLEPWRP